MYTSPVFSYLEQQGNVLEPSFYGQIQRLMGGDRDVAIVPQPYVLRSLSSRILSACCGLGIGVFSCFKLCLQSSGRQ